MSSGAYPPGCSQAMHDRYFADEDREKCPECGGTGEAPVLPLGSIYGNCPACHGSGYEPIPDSREDDAYDAARESNDVEF